MTSRHPQVISIDGPKITMLPKHQDLKDPLEFQANELKKYFRQVKFVFVGKFWMYVSREIT